MPKMHFTVTAGEMVDPYRVMVNSDLAVENTPPHFIRITDNDPDMGVRIGTLPALTVDGSLNPTSGWILSPGANQDPWQLNVDAGTRYGFCGDNGQALSDVWVIIIQDTIYDA